jgi:hypothetical protein
MPSGLQSVELRWTIGAAFHSRQGIDEFRGQKSCAKSLLLKLSRQELYAVNDLFIGPKTHASARYEIRLGDKAEIHSSSGVIVSTGLGSTGWLRSIITGSTGIAASLEPQARRMSQIHMPWDARYLHFAVREPFPSVSSQATLVFGTTDQTHPLALRSMMPENGVIFSDGMEADFLNFTSGLIASISVAERVGQLVQ